MSSPAEPRRARPSVRVLLVALLLWAALMRVWTALPNPTRSRFWDDRYGVVNVVRVLETGSLRPARGFHPTLSYLPQALVLAGAQQLHERLGWPAAVLAGRDLTPLGYLLCRLVQAAIGVASVWLLYRLGRRLFDPTVGLVAAFLFAAVPWHLRQSVIFKPDILLLLTGILAVLASLRALDRPAPRRFALAGGAIGLCLASKFNAPPFAVPLAIGALWRAREDRRLLLWLAMAGAVSIAVLLALDPWLVLAPELYRKDFGHTLGDYARKGRSAGMSAWELPVHAATVLLGPLHGPWLGLLALLVILASLVPRATRDWPPARRRGWLALVGFVLAYVLAYSLVTRNPSPHNWLLLTPVTSLAAALGVVEIARRAAGRWPALARAAPGAVLLFLAAASWPLHVWAYAETVPTTAEVAEAELLRELPPTSGALVLTEVPLRPSLIGPARQGSIKRAARRTPRVVRVPRLAVRSAELSLVDALVFPAERLEDPGSARAYGQLLAGQGRRVLRISAAPLRRRGPGLVVVLQPLELLAEERHELAMSPGSPGREPLAAPVTGLAPGTLASVQVTAARRPLDGVVVENGGVEVPCIGTLEGRGGFVCNTLRFRAAAGVRLRVEGPLRNGVSTVMSWRRPS